MLVCLAIMASRFTLGSYQFPMLVGDVGPGEVAALGFDQGEGFKARVIE